MFRALKLPPFLTAGFLSSIVHLSEFRDKQPPAREVWGRDPPAYLCFFNELSEHFLLKMDHNHLLLYKLGHSERQWVWEGG